MVLWFSTKTGKRTFKLLASTTCNGLLLSIRPALTSDSLYCSQEILHSKQSNASHQCSASNSNITADIVCLTDMNNVSRYYYGKGNK